MSDMKCPFCEQWLIPCIQNQNDWIYHCDNPKCPMYDDADIENAKHPLASEDLWQELIRTRKALYVAVSQLKKTRDYIEDCRYQETNYFLVDSKDVSIIFDETNESLKKITALEQKD